MQIWILFRRLSQISRWKKWRRHNKLWLSNYTQASIWALMSDGLNPRLNKQTNNLWLTEIILIIYCRHFKFTCSSRINLDIFWNEFDFFCSLIFFTVKSAVFFKFLFNSFFFSKFQGNKVHHSSIFIRIFSNGCYTVMCGSISRGYFWRQNCPISLIQKRCC